MDLPAKVRSSVPLVRRVMIVVATEAETAVAIAHVMTVVTGAVAAAVAATEVVVTAVAAEIGGKLS